MNVIAKPRCDPLGRVLRFLGNTGQPVWRYLAIGTLLAWVPGQCINLLGLIYPGPTQSDVLKNPYFAIGAVLILAPLLETLLMIPILWLVRKFVRGTVAVCATAGVIWGVLHMASTSWGVFAVWVFFVFNACFLAWEKISRDRAIVMTAALHAGVNATSYTLYLLAQQLSPS